MEIQARRFGDKFLPGQLKVLWFISAIITELFIFLNLKQVSHFYVEFGTTNISSLNFSSNSCSHQPSLKKNALKWFCWLDKKTVQLNISILGRLCCETERDSPGKYLQGLAGYIIPRGCTSCWFSQVFIHLKYLNKSRRLQNVTD